MKHIDTGDFINPSKPKYLEWYSPYLDLEHTIQVCRGERVKYTPYFINNYTVRNYLNKGMAI